MMLSALVYYGLAIRLCVSVTNNVLTDAQQTVTACLANAGSTCNLNSSAVRALALAAPIQASWYRYYRQIVV